MSNSQLCDRDFHAWANQQAELPRGNRLAEADLENIAGELESMGRGEKRRQDWSANRNRLDRG